jgi:hypothetical protein
VVGVLPVEGKLPPWQHRMLWAVVQQRNAALQAHAAGAAPHSRFHHHPASISLCPTFGPSPANTYAKRSPPAGAISACC